MIVLGIYLKADINKSKANNLEKELNGYGNLSESRKYEL